MTESSWIGNYYVPANVKPVFAAAKHIIEQRGRLNILAIGPSGCGKTDFFRAMAELYGLAFLRVDCSTIPDPTGWFGTREANAGTTSFAFSPFAEAISQGHAVIVLDEVNRLEPWIANSLFPILDHERKTSVYGHEIAVGPAVIFGMTANGWGGGDSNYVGTFAVDKALANRVQATVFMTNLPKRIEQAVVRRNYPDVEVTGISIVSIVEAMVKLRAAATKEQVYDLVDLSTRATLNVSRLIDAGLSLRDAVTLAICNASPDEARKALFDTLNQITVAAPAEPLESEEFDPSEVAF